MTSGGEFFLRETRAVWRAVSRGRYSRGRKRARRLVQRARMQVTCPVAGAYHRLFVGEPDLERVPVVINSYDRLDCLLKLIAWLESRRLTNIVILDNASRYPPLLEYYARTPYEVIFLGRNVGHTAIWDSEVWPRFRNGYYVYTDPDVVPEETCPVDVMEVFLRALREHRRCGKVGFGLRIDDLPETYAHRADVVAWEEQHWARRVGPNLYDAPIDTTFALYRPWAEGGYWCPALRTGPPYVARHLPWYADSSRPTAEDLWYAQAVRMATHWTAVRRHPGRRRGRSGDRLR